MAGVTRDRVAAPVQMGDRWIELVDTGGIGIVDTQSLEEHVEAQIQQALEIADALVFVTDGREGCTAMDQEIALALRGRNVPVILAVNKTESKAGEAAVGEFGKLGFEPWAVSALERLGMDDLQTAVLEAVEDVAEAEDGDVPGEPVLKVALVGRVNVGKSTFLNHLAGAQRTIVSEVPGTTRDSVDVMIEKDGRKMLVTDTAGLKREKQVDGSVEFYAQRRAEHSIRRAEVSLLMLDCTSEITRGDKRIASFIETECRPVVIVANKWDLVKGGMELADYADYVAKRLPGLHYAPIVFVTAKEGRNVLAALETAESLAKQSKERVGTPAINKALERARSEFLPPVRVRRTPKIYYGTQTDVNPPTIMLFVNDPRLFRSGYRRFLENRLREVLPFKEIPLRLVYRRRRSIFSGNRGGTRGGGTRGGGSQDKGPRRKDTRNKDTRSKR